MDKMRLLASLDIDVYLQCASDDPSNHQGNTCLMHELDEHSYERVCEPMIDDIGDSISECVNRLREKYPDLYIEINGVC